MACEMIPLRSYQDQYDAMIRLYPHVVDVTGLRINFVATHGPEARFHRWAEDDDLCGQCTLFYGPVTVVQERPIHRSVQHLYIGFTDANTAFLFKLATNILRSY